MKKIIIGFIIFILLLTSSFTYLYLNLKQDNQMLKKEIEDIQISIKEKDSEIDTLTEENEKQTKKLKKLKDIEKDYEKLKEEKKENDSKTKEVAQNQIINQKKQEMLDFVAGIREIHNEIKQSIPLDNYEYTSVEEWAFDLYPTLPILYGVIIRENAEEIEVNLPEELESVWQEINDWQALYHNNISDYITELNVIIDYEFNISTLSEESYHEIMLDIIDNVTKADQMYENIISQLQ